jgi:hypothetical protein
MSITQEHQKIKLNNCDDLFTYYKTVPAKLREFSNQADDFSNIDIMLTKKCNLIFNNVNLSYDKASIKNDGFSSLISSHKSESISTLSEQVSKATDCVSLPLNNLSTYPEVRDYLFKTPKALENDVFSNTGESISTLSEQLSVTPECLALPLNELTMNPEVSESLVKIAEILNQVPPIA